MGKTAATPGRTGPSDRSESLTQRHEDDLKLLRELARATRQPFKKPVRPKSDNRYAVPGQDSQ